MAKRVNATRMELLRLTRRVALAKRGHKLLKDKLDGLIQHLLGLVRTQRNLHQKLEEELGPAFENLILASAQIPPELTPAAVSIPDCKTEVEIALKNIMGVKIPKYDLKITGNPLSYSFANVPAELDQTLMRFKEILPELVKLAEYNKAITVIASEIIEIKRRVNALEHILIPELENALRYIRMKLSEMERSATVALLRIKDIVAAS